jgi:hypothetical protein
MLGVEYEDDSFEMISKTAVIQARNKMFGKELREIREQQDLDDADEIERMKRGVSENEWFDEQWGRRRG